MSELHKQVWIDLAVDSAKRIKAMCEPRSAIWREADLIIGFIGPLPANGRPPAPRSDVSAGEGDEGGEIEGEPR